MEILPNAMPNKVLPHYQVGVFLLRERLNFPPNLFECHPRGADSYRGVQSCLCAFHERLCRVCDVTDKKRPAQKTPCYEGGYENMHSSHLIALWGFPFHVLFGCKGCMHRTILLDASPFHFLFGCKNNLVSRLCVHHTMRALQDPMPNQQGWP